MYNLYFKKCLDSFFCIKTEKSKDCDNLTLHFDTDDSAVIKLGGLCKNINKKLCKINTDRLTDGLHTIVLTLGAKSFELADLEIFNKRIRSISSPSSYKESISLAIVKLYEKTKDLDEKFSDLKKYFKSENLI